MSTPTQPVLRVCAVIPAYDEAGSIGEVVTGARRHVSRLVVVDDGSKDGTGQTAAAAGAVVLRHDRNRGKGAALRTGLAWVLARSFTHVLLMDADRQHDPTDIPTLLELARKGPCDVVIGERAFDRQTMPASRYYTNVISSWVISQFFVGATVRDAQSGFRLIRSDLLRGIRLTARGYEIETEMLIKLRRRGAVVTSGRVQLRYDGARSKLRPLRDTTRTCFLAVRYRFFPERWA